MSIIAHVKPIEFRGTPNALEVMDNPERSLKTVNGYPAYTVSSDGVVIGARGKPLKPDLNSVGYQRITLCKDGKTKRVFIHRLVAEHFVDNPDLHKYVNHIDGCRTNNNAGNLEWCSASYNVKDGWNRGRALCGASLASFLKRATTIP